MLLIKPLDSRTAKFISSHVQGFCPRHSDGTIVCSFDAPQSVDRTFDSVLMSVYKRFNSSRAVIRLSASFSMCRWSIRPVLSLWL